MSGVMRERALVGGDGNGGGRWTRLYSLLHKYFCWEVI
jgi:hypothetical protein